MKVLIVGSFSSAAALVLKLAKDNPNVDFDFLGVDCSLFKHYSNLNRIIIDPSKEESNFDIVEYTFTNYYKYDFIYANDDFFQFDERFAEFKKLCGVPVLSPCKDSFKLERSKLHCKSLFEDLTIPSPAFKLVDNYESVEEEFKTKDTVILKLNTTRIATGYATWVATKQNYKKWIDYVKKSDPDECIFLEDHIEGAELSFHILSNGESWIYIGSSRDYKKIYNGDTGINCTSAGCYSPVDYLTPEIVSKISTYVDKIIEYQHSQGTPYIGIMYLGVIIDKNGIPNILEINTRPGNPEFAAILPTIKTNLLDNLINAAKKSQLSSIEFNDNYTTAIQLLHLNYTWKYPEKIIPPFFSADKNVAIYKMKDMRLFRNLDSCIVHTANDFQSSYQYIYEYLANQYLGTYRYRTDIGILR